MQHRTKSSMLAVLNNTVNQQAVTMQRQDSKHQQQNSKIQQQDSKIQQQESKIQQPSSQLSITIFLYFGQRQGQVMQ
jgi:uncharacterized protein (DUF3084 family)